MTLEILRGQAETSENLAGFTKLAGGKIDTGRSLFSGLRRNRPRRGKFFNSAVLDVSRPNNIPENKAFNFLILLSVSQTDHPVAYLRGPVRSALPTKERLRSDENIAVLCAERRSQVPPECDRQACEGLVVGPILGNRRIVGHEVAPVSQAGDVIKVECRKAYTLVVSGVAQADRMRERRREDVPALENLTYSAVPWNTVCPVPSSGRAAESKANSPDTTMP